MQNDLISRQRITAIINGFDHTIYPEEENEDLSTVILQKKVKKLNEQIIYLHAENRLLYNYLSWYEKKVLHTNDNQRRLSFVKSQSHQILKHKSKQPLTIEKKREIAEACFKVLLAYSDRIQLTTNEYIDECFDTIETNDQIINHFEIELNILNKFYQSQKKISGEELREFLHERTRYQEALDERKRQKTVRLRFHIDELDKSIRKVHQIVDTVTEVDFEQLKIDIEKQLKELNLKNKMLNFYKQQQSEANMKFNIKKPELAQEIRILTTIRNEINNKTQQINHYNNIKEKMQEEIFEYEKLNEPLRQMTLTYRVPSIHDYIELKSKQLNLSHQEHIWQRKVEIAERELHLRQIQLSKYPEEIIHPWKYLQNPSSILFSQ